MLLSFINLAATAAVLAALWHIRKLIMATSAELDAKLAALAARAEKVKAEVIAAIEALNATATTPEQDALLERVAAAVGGLDDLNADTPPV